MAVESWLRGDSPDAARRDARRVIERDEAEDHEALFESMYIGTSALRLMRGVAELHDVRAVMSRLVVDIEAGIQQNTMVMLTEEDPNSTAARKAHFEARVLASMMNFLNEYVRKGIEAGRALNQQESPDGR